MKKTRTFIEEKDIFDFSELKKINDSSAQIQNNNTT
jgi:hypothetical protein